MIAIGVVLAIIAALVHCFIFYLESIAWTSERARTAFGTTVETAETTKPLAFNQGFYNAFLSVEVVVGLIIVAAGQRGVGFALVVAGVLSMCSAALVLVASDRTKARAAAVQGVVPFLAFVTLAIGLL